MRASRRSFVNSCVAKVGQKWTIRGAPGRAPSGRPTARLRPEQERTTHLVLQREVTTGTKSTSTSHHRPAGCSTTVHDYSRKSLDHFLALRERLERRELIGGSTFKFGHSQETERVTIHAQCTAGEQKGGWLPGGDHSMWGRWRKKSDTCHIACRAAGVRTSRTLCGRSLLDHDRGKGLTECTTTQELASSVHAKGERRRASEGEHGNGTC